MTAAERSIQWAIPQPFAPPSICIVEPTQRWQIAWRRFAPVINRPEYQISQRLIVHAVSPAEAVDIGAIETLPNVWAVFWDLQSSEPQSINFAAMTAKVVATRRQLRRVIQFAADARLSAVQIASLTELGISATAAGPEDLPKLGRMIQRL